eukprot:TRINITY_DN27349_c0_g1_i1.p1 TRINITY_DN27349_c0_g1~~TRINITY_DN27349_c0_g1_i1.p1  ORF type:complete len:736 (-),score=116.25 TRINITY_DN27349_c0_g1_i1:466-2673(-)
MALRPLIMLQRLLLRALERASSAGLQRRCFAQHAAATPWAICARATDNESQAAASIQTYGFVILKDLLSREALEQIRAPFVTQMEHVISQLSEKGIHIDVGSQAGFHEVVLRSPGRWDVPCDFDAVPAEVRARFEDVCANVLGSDMSRAFAGIVRADPGCPAQLWHADSPHQSAEHAPANLLNVLVAIADVKLEDGPTDLIPASHTHTNHLRPNVTFGEELLYQTPGNSPSLIGSSEAPVSAEMTAGSALIFDDRILHRGGFNNSARVRDVAFFSYRRSNFKPDTHYEAVRSLSSYNHQSMATTVRSEFPGLSPPGYEVSPVLGDGASGSQLHESVIAAVVEQMRYGTANIGGSYASSEKAQAAVANARSAMSDLLGCSPVEVAFGPSMTALVFHLASAFRNDASLFKPGDNVVLDPISHGGNVWPWVRLAKACGAEVRWLPVAGKSVGAEDSDCMLHTDPNLLATVIDSRTRLVAAGFASNGVGTVHDVQSICKAARELSNGQALSFVDAVHYAPHGYIDVEKIGCDFLVCSPYKFFAPHSGVLFGRRELLERLPAQRLDCSDDTLPSEANCDMSRWELGTQNYEALAGVAAAVDYLASLGTRFGGASGDMARRDRLKAGFLAIAAHERELKVRFLEGAAQIPSLRLLGIPDPQRSASRTSTFAVAKAGLEPQTLASRLCAQGVWCTAGNHYAGFWSAQSGGFATDEEGMARIGLLHYNTLEEVDRILQALDAA